MDGFLAHFESYECMLCDFHDFSGFGVVLGGLTLLPEGPRTRQVCPECPLTLRECLVRLATTRPDWSQLVETDRN